MELKLIGSVAMHSHISLLLIVPYGIETRIAESVCLFVILLLIVPYGIETRNDGFFEQQHTGF